MTDTVSYSYWQKLLDNLDLKARNSSHFMPKSVEVTVQCPNCKTIETVEVMGNTLVPCRKFYQKGVHIYHDCDPDQPCLICH